MAELIALAKAKPGKLNYASSGYGAAAHLAGELFKAQAQIDIVHVAYKGAAPALQDVIAGHVQMMFATAASVVGHIKDGLVRAARRDDAEAHRAAAGSRRPSPSSAFRASMPPPGTAWSRRPRTPQEVIETLHRATVTALNDPATRKSLGDLGVDIVGSSPEDSPPTSRPKSRNGPRSCRRPVRRWSNPPPSW